jgi:hypothetical protein
LSQGCLPAMRIPVSLPLNIDVSELINEQREHQHHLFYCHDLVFLSCSIWFPSAAASAHTRLNTACYSPAPPVRRSPHLQAKPAQPSPTGCLPRNQASCPPSARDLSEGARLRACPAASLFQAQQHPQPRRRHLVRALNASDVLSGRQPDLQRQVHPTLPAQETYPRHSLSTSLQLLLQDQA